MLSPIAARTSRDACARLADLSKARPAATSTLHPFTTPARSFRHVTSECRLCIGQEADRLDPIRQGLIRSTSPPDFLYHARVSNFDLTFMLYAVFSAFLCGMTPLLPIREMAAAPDSLLVAAK
jgi:hypothetical protein